MGTGSGEIHINIGKAVDLSRELSTHGLPVSSGSKPAMPDSGTAEMISNGRVFQPMTDGLKTSCARDAWRSASSASTGVPLWFGIHDLSGVT